VSEPPTLPVARVVVDLIPPHLDRLFDYAVPAELAEAAQPGVRVTVRFSGRRAKGFVLERRAASTHLGTLSPLLTVVSPERVLSGEVARLARAVADRWAGTLSDVLRLAVPPRHARVEREPFVPPPASAPPTVSDKTWQPYRGGPALLSALQAGQPARAVWTALPGADWAAALGEAVAAATSGGGGAIVVVPDAREVTRCHAALTTILGADAAVALTADLGPAERYRRFLQVSRGARRVVVGTRAAAFAPVHDLRLCVVWDDGDDSLAEPRAPYPHARDVLLLRAHQAGCAVVLGAHVPSVEAFGLVSTGWARAVQADRGVVRQYAARTEVAGSDTALARDEGARAARLPTLAFEAARRAFAMPAPVLVQVPRRGYQSALACVRCRAPARCVHCAGPLQRAAADAALSCAWCGHVATGWACAECGAQGLRAAVAGERRTAEELGRAFPGVPVLLSGGDHVLDAVPSAGAALVVATPGAEPAPPAGYGAVLLLDAWSPLGRPDLRAAEQALRRWSAAAALARPAGAGGQVVLVGADVAIPAVQALVRWDPLGFLRRESEQRAELGFPPATRMAAVEGANRPVADFVADVLALPEAPGGLDVLGPVPLDDATDRTLLRAPRERGGELAAVLALAQRRRSASRVGEAVRVRLDPLVVG